MKGYKTSKDYSLLWELIQQEYEIPCLISNVRDEPGKHLVLVSKFIEGYQLYSFAAVFERRLISTVDQFKALCNTSELEFIPPTNTETE